VDCFRALGIGAIVAESYGAIYKRNAINSGFPIVVLPELTKLHDQFKSGDRVAIDFEKGRLVLNDTEIFQTQPFSRVQVDIYRAGDLFAYGRALDQA
jgi:3-isopropylmalate dehydratase small subunit